MGELPDLITHVCTYVYADIQYFVALQIAHAYILYIGTYVCMYIQPNYRKMSPELLGGSAVVSQLQG